MQFINDTTASADAAASTQPTPAVQASPDGSTQPTSVPLAVDGVQTSAPSSLPGANTPDQAAADAQALVEADSADKNFFGRVNAMKPTPNMSPELDTDGSNPIQVSDMTPTTKAAMIRQLQRNARFGTTVTDADLQATLDKDYDIYVTHGVAIPQQQMYLDKDRNPDIGAYNQAVADYPVKKAAAMKAYLDKEGGIYGINFDQDLKSQANSRANQQNTRDQGNYARSVRDWKLQNASMEDLQSMGYKGIDKTNMEEARSVEGARDNILGIENQLGHLKIDSRKMSRGEFNGSVVSVFNKIAELDAAKTEGDRGNIENILLQHKDFRSIISRHGTDWRGAALEFFTRQSKKGTMAIMDEMVNNAKRYGQVNGAAQKFGNKNVWAKHIGDKRVLPSGKEAVWNGRSWGVE